MGAKIYNSELTRELREGARLQTSVDPTPTEIAEKVVPVMEVNPKLLKIINAHKYNEIATASGFNIMTTPIDKDFYLCNLDYSLIKDATSDMTSGTTYISAIINGETIRLCVFQTITLTAQQVYVNISFPFPIKIDRGTNIASPSTGATVGNCRRAGSAHGYYENINA